MSDTQKLTTHWEQRELVLEETKEALGGRPQFSPGAEEALKKALAEALQARLQALDKELGEGLDSLIEAATVLDAVHHAFPLDDGNMGPDFKGTHHLYLKDGTLHVGVWADGKLWDFCYPQADL